MSAATGGKSLIELDRTAKLFLRGLASFVFQDPLLRARAARPFLATSFLDLRASGVGAAFASGFDLVEQKVPGDEAVEALLTSRLAFDLSASRAMKQHHAGRHFVDILAAVPA